MHELRIIIKGIQVVFDAEQDAGKPKEAIQRKPENRVPAGAVFQILPYAPVKPLQQLIGKESWADAFIVPFIQHQRRTVGGGRRQSRSSGGTPELMEQVLPPIVVDAVSPVVCGRESFPPPAGEGLIPPACPFNDRRAVDGGIPAEEKAETLGIGKRHGEMWIRDRGRTVQVFFRFL